MCGSPAVPSAKAMPVEMLSSGLTKSPPGARKASPLPDRSAARESIFDGSKSNFPSTQTAITETQHSRSTALMICTHVVASIPPKIT